MPPSSRSKKRDKQAPSRKTGNAPQQAQQAFQGSDADTLRPHILPFEIQQIILNTFNSAFPIVQDPEQLKRLIQDVKGHLFNRDFSAAFGQPLYLQAYALRWSAARALSYSQILSDPKRSTTLFSYTESALTEEVSVSKSPSDVDNPKSVAELSSTLSKVVCIGGGAGGEVVALAAAHRTLGATNALSIFAVDSADWSEPISKLSSALSVAATLPSYSSKDFKSRPENQPLLEDRSRVNITFMHQDVLSWPTQSFQDTFQSASLCTLMFTLNELFSTSLPKTTSFLLQLTDFMPIGSHLLVIDSPGSYSEISLGKSKGGSGSTAAAVAESSTPSKKYPMKWLLDHTLLEVASQANARWVKVESEDSLWFRIDQKDRERLKYPVELENMRYQLHLYRRV